MYYRNLACCFFNVDSSIKGYLQGPIQTPIVTNIAWLSTLKQYRCEFNTVLIYEVPHINDDSV